MKRVFLVLLAMLLALSMALSSCNTPDNSGTPSQSSTPQADPEPDSEPDSEPEPHTVSYNYMPDALSDEMKALFEAKPTSAAFASVNLSTGPYAPADVFTISDCKVTSITIPVYKTLAADKDGNFTFTIYVISNVLENMRKAPIETHAIKINAEEYGLTEKSNVVKYITVDLTDYNIVLTEKQSLAFCATSDTLIPAYLKTSASSVASNLLKSEFGVTCMYNNVGKSSLIYDRDSLFFDFTFERTYESEDAYNDFIKAEEDAEKEYQRMLREVTLAYRGKNLSLLGDSISTFDGVTNSVKVSTSMTNHRCYYRSSLLPDYTYTYWGRLQTETQMKLCVINGWSSSKVYGGGQGADNKVDATKDNILVRSSYLHNNAGQNPDLVIIYMGINDTRSSPSSIQTDSTKSSYTRNKTAGDLYVRLTDKNKTKTDYEIVDEWFKEVKAMAATTGTEVKPGTTYNTWEGAYALAIDNILTKYNNPDIFCMTLIKNHHAAAEASLVNRSNVLIRAIANYFGVGIIDQDNSEITMDNCHVYGADENETVTSLHPNIKGHEMTTRLIVREIYKYLQNKNNAQ